VAQMKAWEIIFHICGLGACFGWATSWLWIYLQVALFGRVIIGIEPSLPILWFEILTACFTMFYVAVQTIRFIRLLDKIPEEVKREL